MSGSKLRRTFPLLLAALVTVSHPACLQAKQSEAPTPPLSIHGNISVFEIAPILLVTHQHPEMATLKMGGLPNLFGERGVPGYFAEGRADVATHADTQALRYSVKHPDLRIILTVSEGIYRIVGRKSAGIASLADLRGKRIATVPNTSSHYFLFRMLKSVGLTEADVTIVPILPLSDMPRALAAREVDAVTIWEPEVERASAAIGADAIEFNNAKVYREIFGLNTTAATLADPLKRRQIVKLVRDIRQASTTMKANPAVVWPLVAKSSGYSVGQVEGSWSHQVYPGTLAPDLLDVLVDEEQWLANRDGRVPRGRQELGKLIDHSILDDAMSGDELQR